MLWWGDWLMLYGEPTAAGKLFWLTTGAAQIAQWRNTLAMALAFPGIIFYAFALFALAEFIPNQHSAKIYRILTTIGLLPWLALHLFYILLLALFAQLNAIDTAQSALTITETLYFQLQWIIPTSEIFMLLPFVYWFYLQITARTIFPRLYAFSNVLIIYLILSIIKLALPLSAFRLGFTNGLMSESMIIFFSITFFGGYYYSKKRNALY